MSRSKYFCLGCEQTNACKCGNDNLHFWFSHKLRPPKKSESNAVWRKFLLDCPQFVNMVSPDVFEEFNRFLKSKGWKGQHINYFKTPLEVDKTNAFMKARFRIKTCRF